MKSCLFFIFNLLSAFFKKMHFIVLRDSLLCTRTSKAFKLEINPFGFENFLEECSLVGKLCIKINLLIALIPLTNFFIL